jgi:hypothetical protein
MALPENRHRVSGKAMRTASIPFNNAIIFIAGAFRNPTVRD